MSFSAPPPVGPATPAAPPPATKGSGWWRVVREILIVLVTAIVLSVVVRTFFVQAFYVPSQSMENTLLPNDRILASKITNTVSGVTRGQLVVFRDPGGWLPDPIDSPNPPAQQFLEFIGLIPSSSGDDLVKRVIGIGGDRVSCCDPQGRIVVNGVSLDEPYLKPGTATDQIIFDIEVPQGSVFVMGDNRPESADSRYHLARNSGAVPLDNVVGNVFTTVWPIGRFETFGIPPVPFNNPVLGPDKAQ
jgi:signal peptidase I